MAQQPERVHVRMYQVGFGDCFVVSFYYRQQLDDLRKERHILIDFGSTHSPGRGPRKLLGRAADLIDEHTGGQIDVVVATHRHRDHLSGFADAAAAGLIGKLEPKLVVRPWTDDPTLADDATAPASANFAASLSIGQELAAAVVNRAGDPDRRSLRGELAAMALDQLPNKEAIERLESWADNGRGEYLAAGMKTKIGKVVPGITVRVLGPPTIDEWPEMTRQRRNDPEYWLAQRELWRAQETHLTDVPEASLEADVPAELDVDVERGEEEPVGPVSWLIERLQRQHLHSLMRIVRTVDDALNNTSLILLIDAGDKRMLFPGDAQIENWSWALNHASNRKKLRELLAGVHLYKVGHHGSRNATPRTLFRLWGEDPDPEREMVSLMSTLHDVHGDTPATAVPRTTLVEALRRRTDLYTTDRLPSKDPFVEVAAKTSGGGKFERVDDGG